MRAETGSYTDAPGMKFHADAVAPFLTDSVAAPVVNLKGNVRATPAAGAIATPGMAAMPITTNKQTN